MQKDNLKQETEKYIAHRNEETGEIQTVQEHCENVARLCQEFAIPELKEILYAIGLLHDCGKYQDSFQRRIRGENVRVEHSACGVIAAQETYQGVIGLLMACCIAGHHGGIPDLGNFNDTPDMATLKGRLKRTFEDYSAYREQLNLPEIPSVPFVQFLAEDCENLPAKEQNKKLIDKFAFVTRYCFSCLVDADTLDTAGFCGTGRNRALQADFEKCLAKVNERLNSFVCVTELQKARAGLQRQAFEKVQSEGEIFLLHMPTGSGKTLCSLKFALERAIRQGKKRIIYIIPYTSIIDQAAAEFAQILGDDAEILRHQSTFSYEDAEDYEEDYRLNAKFAIENWDAPIVITTAVQFFESIYSNKRGKLRKMHNMADSILVFDEAHLMPREFLQPCLEAISYFTKYCHSEALFLTATMPDFENLVTKYGLQSSRVTKLIEDTTGFEKFRKCNYTYLGEVEREPILAKAAEFPSALVIVNTRKAAKEFFQAAATKKKYHLSTHMTPFDREKVIRKIRDELTALERDFPKLQNVPDERKILVVSTSLIEAGVDLDFSAVFRELAGLDSILQAGGRCNREGKQAKGAVFIFERRENAGKPNPIKEASIARSILKTYEVLDCPESIAAYYRQVYTLSANDVVKNSMYQYCSSIDTIRFREYAEKVMKLIDDSKTVSVVVPRDEKSGALVEQLKHTGYADARVLQKYAFTVYQNEFNELFKQNVVDDFDSGIYCLINEDYYDEKVGVIFEARDYII